MNCFHDYTFSDHYRSSDTPYVFVNWGGCKIYNKDVCAFIAREFSMAGYEGYYTKIIYNTI